MKLLIVSASTGMGHMAAARGIEKAAQLRGHQARTIDVMEHVPPGYRQWYRGGYERLVRKNPQMWGHLYRTSDRPLFNYRFQTMLDYLSSQVVVKLIRKERPDWVVCTHSVSQPRIPAGGRRMAVVVTDLYPHRMWLRGGPDLFCLPSEWSAEILRRRVPQASYVITGIPISPEFHPGGEEPNEGQVLMTAGGISGGPVAEAARQLSTTNLHVVTGWNEGLRTELQGDPLMRQATVHGFVDPPVMAGLMQRSSLLVGKSGGLTTMEALAVGIPFVVYQPFLIPGQEEQNATFLEQSGAGVRTRTPMELRETVHNLLANPSKLATMRESALAHGKPDAAEQVVKALEARL